MLHVGKNIHMYHRRPNDELKYKWRKQTEVYDIVLLPYASQVASRFRRLLELFNFHCSRFASRTFQCILIKIQLKNWFSKHSFLIFVYECHFGEDKKNSCIDHRKRKKWKKNINKWIQTKISLWFQFSFIFIHSVRVRQCARGHPMFH